LTTKIGINVHPLDLPRRETWLRAKGDRSG